MDRLIKKLHQSGQTFVGVLLIGGVFYLYAHSPKVAGAEPKREFCRDYLDYELMMRQWKRRGTYILFADENFGKALDGAIQRA